LAKSAARTDGAISVFFIYAEFISASYLLKMLVVYAEFISASVVCAKVNYI
jgi:hypothetical protein